MEVLVGAAVLVLLWIIVSVKNAKAKARKEELLNKPFPESYLKILDANFKTYRKIAKDQQKKLFGLIHLFIDEKDFTGCEGLEITDEIKVTIAAQACLLLLNNKTQPWYKKLHTILVYPSAYIAKDTSVEDDVISEEDSVRLGESWGGGSIVLSWSHSKKGGRNFHDGENVILHEFAHQLDQVDGPADGVPNFDQRSSYLNWANLLSAEYKKLLRKTMKNQKTLLDKYGATNEAEFFAVATECFFEKPKQMSKKHPELYESLSRYYGLNPKEWK